MIKAYKIIRPLRHGQNGKLYKFRPGDTVPPNFFPEEILSDLLQWKIVEPVKVNEEEQGVPKAPKAAKKLESLKDITSMTAAQAKELINAEVSTSNLEKYKDQELGSHKPRKSVLDFIDSRMKELTGYEA